MDGRGRVSMGLPRQGEGEQSAWTGGGGVSMGTRRGKRSFSLALASRTCILRKGRGGEGGRGKSKRGENARPGGGFGMEGNATAQHGDKARFGHSLLTTLCFFVRPRGCRVELLYPHPVLRTCLKRALKARCSSLSSCWISSTCTALRPGV